jgi:anti-anti-sigma factor
METSDRCDGPIVEEEPAFFVKAGAGGRVRLFGELDIAGVPALRAVLVGVDGDIELDCSALTFIDCSGLRVLQEAARACETAGAHLWLIAPSRCVIRLLGLTGLLGRFDVRDGSS